MTQQQAERATALRMADTNWPAYVTVLLTLGLLMALFQYQHDPVQAEYDRMRERQTRFATQLPLLSKYQALMAAEDERKSQELQQAVAGHLDDVRASAGLEPLGLAAAAGGRGGAGSAQ